NYLLYGNFLDIMPNKYTIKNFSGYHSMEKPSSNLLEQVCDVIRLKHYVYKCELRLPTYQRLYRVFFLNDLLVCLWLTNFWTIVSETDIALKARLYLALCRILVRFAF
ncbi:MAG: hypothetical protein AB4426_04675, partial [Xenococcaceae cyanobacterium]